MKSRTTNESSRPLPYLDGVPSVDGHRLPLCRLPWIGLLMATILTGCSPTPSEPALSETPSATSSTPSGSNGEATYAPADGTSGSSTPPTQVPGTDDQPPLESGPEPNDPANAADVVAPQDGEESDEMADNPDIASPDQPDLPVDPTWTRLTKDGAVWIDLKKHTVIASGRVCLRRGPLEMFACPPRTKEYESIVAVNCPAFMIHGALLAVGAQPGSTVKSSPYQAAKGPIVDIFVRWLDEDGNLRRERAQEWIRHNKTGKPMDYDFVFCGSGFETDEETGQSHYYAEGGELICVSNFPTATIDLPVRSPQDNQGLWFDAFTDKIPKLETKVQLELIPRLNPHNPPPNPKGEEEIDKAETPLPSQTGPPTGSVKPGASESSRDPQ